MMKAGTRYVLILKRDRGGEWFYKTGGAGEDRNTWVPLSSFDAKEISGILAREAARGKA
jgi:hypothetical protein